MNFSEEELEEMRKTVTEIVNDPVKFQEFIDSIAKDEFYLSLVEGISNDKEDNVIQNNCDHGVVFDEEDAKKIGDSYEIKKKYPRGDGLCPKGCGYSGIAYASYMHYIMGDW